MQIRPINPTPAARFPTTPQREALHIGTRYLLADCQVRHAGQVADLSFLTMCPVAFGRLTPPAHHPERDGIHPPSQLAQLIGVPFRNLAGHLAVEPAEVGILAHRLADSPVLAGQTVQGV